MAETPPWRCPVCRAPLAPADGALRCPSGHSFDVARQGYVNLLIAGQRRSRQPGDSAEMVAARRRFLATGAYDRLSDAVGREVRAAAGRIVAADPGATVFVLDVGCGDGHHTRRIMANVAGNMTAAAAGLDPLPARWAGIDVAKPAIAAAAAADRAGWYAVASAGDVPLADASVDIAVNVFGPVLPGELARVVRLGGMVVIAHPGASHLASLRALVYADARPHEVKDPLRNDLEVFAPAGRTAVMFPVVISDAGVLRDLFTMTPYRWHAPPGMDAVLADCAQRGFATTVDVVVSAYVRVPGPVRSPS